MYLIFHQVIQLIPFINAKREGIILKSFNPRMNSFNSVLEDLVI